MGKRSSRTPNDDTGDTDGTSGTSGTSGTDGTEPTGAASRDGTAEHWLTPPVAAVGAASFFSDSGHEMVTAVLPGFITGVLHGSAAALGVIEGISDALTGVAKLLGGPLANDEARRGRLASSGYLITAIATSAIGLATAVWQVGVLRAIAWAARGLRSPARDSLLSSLARPGATGRSFGVERAGDNIGAVVGPLVAAGLVAWVGIRPTMWLAFIPGILAAVAITIAARGALRHRGTVRAQLRFQARELASAGLTRPLLPIMFFECGNLATTLLILRATQQLARGGLAQAAALAIVLYAAHNAVAAIVALAGGRWLDGTGPGRVFATGAALYVLAYAGFGFAGDAWWMLLAAFALAGAGIGLAETAESALVAQLLPDRLRGSGFGVLGGIQAGGNIIGTLVAGVLYTAVSASAAFAYAAVWMLLSVASSSFLARSHPREDAHE